MRARVSRAGLGLLLGVVVVAGVAMVGAGASRTRPKADRPVPPGDLPEELEPLPEGAEEAVRWIAANYKDWGRASDWLSWSPADCRLAPTTRTVAASRSGDEQTHGRKLYYLFARDVGSYLRSVPEFGGIDQRESRHLNSPGQVLVKEGWHPVDLGAVEADADGIVRTAPKADGDLAMFEGRWYTPGEQGDLFIMYRRSIDTPDTDAGWRYAIVRPGEIAEILADGLVESCMGCHDESDHDRILGIWEPTPGQGH